MIQGFKVALII